LLLGWYRGHWDNSADPYPSEEGRGGYSGQTYDER
jgi:hypothetical protein